MTVDVPKRLAEIAKLIKAGASPKKFEKEIDRLLGTEMEERDEEAEAKWENDYRKFREE
jgi:hypothetical protein